MKTNFIIEEFTDIDMLITSTMLCVIKNSSLDLVYLKNKTFYKLLSPDNKKVLCNWLKRYCLDITATEDPLDFVLYMKNIMHSVEYHNVHNELLEISRNLVNESKRLGVPAEHLYYVVRYYYHVNITDKVFSQFDNTSLKVLASINVGFAEILKASGLLKIIPILISYNNLNYKIIMKVLKANEKQKNVNIDEAQSALNVLMLYYVIKACKEKPKRVTWVDIVKYLYSEQSMDSTEVFNLCYLED